MTNDVEIIIEPGRRAKQYWRDMWNYRELFYFLAWRDILVRYKQTVIGITWSILRPFFTMIVFTVIFGKVAKMPSNGVPYPILVFAALLPWQFFSASLSKVSTSIVDNNNLISKVYFPRMIIPISGVIVNLVDFIISFFILLVMMLVYRFLPGVKILLLPMFLLVAFVASVGLGLIFSSLNVKYRDFGYIVPFIVQMGLYISPVGFSSSNFGTGKLRLIYSLNPMAGVIDGFRWAILGNQKLFLPGVILSIVISVTLLLLGIRLFRKTEKTFADVI